MGNSVLLSRMISSRLNMIKNCSASGGAIIVSLCSFRSCFVLVFVFEIVICCIVVRLCFSISEAQLRHAFFFCEGRVGFDYSNLLSFVSRFACS